MRFKIDENLFPPRSYAGIIVLRLSRQEKPFVLAVMENVCAKIEVLNPTGALWIVDEQSIRVSRGPAESNSPQD